MSRQPPAVTDLGWEGRNDEGPGRLFGRTNEGEGASVASAAVF